jgi:SSS family solute:Na+ symporter
MIIGFISNKYIKDEVDFLLSGRKLKLFFLTCTLAATHFGGGFITGSIEYSIIYGLKGGIWYGFSCGIGLILLSLLSSKLRKLSLFTAPEYLGRRYNSKFVRIYAAITSLIALIGILSAQIIATSKLFGIFHVDPVVGSVLATIVFIAYTYYGGMWAVTMTDAFQLLIALIFIILLAIITYDSTTIFHITHYEKITNFKIVGIILPTIMYTLIGQDFYQRIFSAKNSKTARRASLLSGLFLCSITILPVVIGLSLSNYGNNLTEAFAAFFKETSSIIGSIFIITMLAAIMSTADSVLSAATSHIVKDIFGECKTIKFNQLKLSKLCVLILGFFALLLSFFMPTIIDALVFSYTIYTATIFFPLVLGFFWQAGEKNAAIFSMIAATIVVLAGYFFNPTKIPLELFGAFVSLFFYIFVSIINYNIRGA